MSAPAEGSHPVPAWAGGGDLETEQVARIVDVLLRVGNATEPGTRQLWVNELERAFPRFSPARSTDAQTDLFNLVRACEARPGAAQRLVTIIKILVGPSRVVSELELQVEILLPAPLLTDEQARRLREALPVECAQHLAAVRSDLVHMVGPAFSGDWLDAVGICGWLAHDKVATAGVPTLFRFVDRLAHELDGAARRRLHEWFEEVWAEQAGSRPAWAATPRAELCSWSERRRQQAGEYVLAAWIEPHGPLDEVRLSRVWLEREGELVLRFPEDEVAPAPADELVEQLGHLVSRVYRVMPRMRRLAVEFVVPRSLMGLPLDQMQVVIDELPCILGGKVPVVLRSSERLELRSIGQPWQQRWQRLWDNPVPFDPETVHWVCQRKPTDQLYYHLAANERMICVAMGYSPETYADPAQDELLAALHAGAPVIVWCRDNAAASRFRRHFPCELRKNGGLSQMPDLALKLRLAAGESSSSGHFGSSLAVVWDDANRLPALLRDLPRFNAPGTGGPQ
ncbi:MAG TPA: hypothetical protein VFM55_21305 [Micromonosporaceae bacterium]|nr:hypothetical protein [Micromonosporaceae bacterium]